VRAMKNRIIENKKRDIERTRKMILKAATKEFDKYGLSGARINNIAKMAKVNRAMVYYIFDNKEDLHLAVVESLFADAIEQVSPHFDKKGITFRDIQQVITIFANVVGGNKEAARIVSLDIISGAKTLRRLKKKRKGLFSNFGKISGALGDLMDKGLIRRQDPNVILMCLIIVALFTSCALPHMDLVTTKGSDEYKRLSSLETWQMFMFDTAMRIITPIEESYLVAANR
jgi:AcrR family transcriptional regulator